MQNFAKIMQSCKVILEFIFSLVESFQRRNTWNTQCSAEKKVLLKKISWFQWSFGIFIASGSMDKLSSVKVEIKSEVDCIWKSALNYFLSVEILCLKLYNYHRINQQKIIRKFNSRVVIIRSTMFLFFSFYFIKKKILQKY